MLYTSLFLLLTYFILAHSDISLYYAFYGFSLWYSKMIPTLLPFMILSGIIIRMNLTGKVTALVHPLFKRIYQCNENVTYAIATGFLFGFPMGAKTAADLYTEKKITKQEGEFLLGFCNNLGPVYFISYVLPLLGITNYAPYLFCMYGLPLLYGILLRFTIYKDKITHKNFSADSSAIKVSLLDATDSSVHSGIENILSLCGYMILFNLLNILPHFLTPHIHMYLSPLLEISGGLHMLGSKNPLYSLVLTSLGGLSCLVQTYSVIRHTPFSLKKYVLHKLFLTTLTILYYLLLFEF